MGMFNFVLDSIKGEIFDFKVKRRVLVATTVPPISLSGSVQPFHGARHIWGLLKIKSRKFKRAKFSSNIYFTTLCFKSLQNVFLEISQ